MSWPSAKPPWTHVKWLSWGDPKLHPWTVGPAIYSSEDLPAQDISGELFALKSQIEVLDASGQWEFLKRSSNPYELVFSQSQDSRIPQSVCSLRPLSRSFFKMTELLSVLDFFKRHQQGPRKLTIQSAHVCEGPGGFIEALLYQAQKQTFIVENSWAMTLKPSKSNIPGWKRAYNFLKRSPMVHIEYGADDTGDILVAANQDSFLEKTRGKCLIFTADGGFDFSEHYSTQEDEVFRLLVSSALIGLQTMVRGGDFILKMFDTELKSTKDLIAILAYCFDSWTLYKPALSRPCNAEKYFLGKGCRVVPAWILRTLTELRDKFTEDTYVESIFNIIPKHIENDIENLKKEYLDQQIAALDYAIKNKETWNNNPYKIWKAICAQSANWCSYFHIPLKYSVESIRV
jgi:23S rRNA U2552 (ribose-2'-O)-methylase RlmE/FtsJ